MIGRNPESPHRGHRMKRLVIYCRGQFGVRALIFCLVCSLAPIRSLAKDYLSINSEPSGATVELDGIVVGKTPYSVEIPGGYLHGAKSVFGKLLRHQLRLKMTLDGY